MEDKVIHQTIAWIKSVVIGCNFCPFAAKAMLQKSIRYVILEEANKASTMASLLNELAYLDDHEDIETTFLITPNDFADFASYLTIVSAAEKAASRQGYDGIYQIASFHPEYCFADSTIDDPANYTNRSIYPMLHLLREESISSALKHYKEPEGIPVANVNYARKKGLVYMQMLRASCIS